jgi:hypothetical protein
MTSGKRFSLTYLDRGAPVRDSERARFRLAKLTEASIKSGYGKSAHDYTEAVAAIVERELGIRFASKAQNGGYYKRWDWFFARVALPDALDTITLLSNYMWGHFSLEKKREQFLAEVARIVEEENLAFRIDEDGSVHPMIDTAFAAATHSTIAALNGSRYSATLELFVAMEDGFKKEPPDYTQSIRSVFAANENLFKLMFSVPRLDAQKAGEKLGPQIQRLTIEGRQLSSSMKLLEAFKDWINAVHFFRHEAGDESLAQPSSALAVALVSQGAAYLRWLAELDRGNIG